MGTERAACFSGQEHSALVERIKSIRAALHTALGPDARKALLAELGGTTNELLDLVLQRLSGPIGG